MRNKGTLIKLVVLLSVFLAFLVMNGLAIDSSSPDGGKVSAERLSTPIKGDDPILSPSELVIEDYKIVSHSFSPRPNISGKENISVKGYSDLYWNDSIHISTATPNNNFLWVNDNSYVYGEGSVGAKYIHVEKASKICAVGGMNAGEFVRVLEGSAIFVKGTFYVGDLELDDTSIIYYTGNIEITGDLILNGEVIPKVNGVREEIKQLVELTADAFDEKLNSAESCPSVPIGNEEEGHPPTGGITPEDLPKYGELDAGKIAAVDREEIDRIVVGDELDYTITVSNTVEDSSPLENVTVEDVLPEGVDFVDGIIRVLDKVDNKVSHIVDNKNDRGFKLTLPEVVYDEDIKITFKVKANGKKLGENINVATITDPKDFENPKKPRAKVNVIPKGILAAEKAASPDRVEIGEEFEYRIIVSNAQEGSKPFKDVIVSDTLPEGVDFVDGIIKVLDKDDNEISHIIDNKNGRGFKLTLPEVAYGTTVKVSFMARATGSKTGSIENIATVKGDSDNVLKPATRVEVIPKGVLAAEKTASAEKVMIGDEYEYTITVSNTQAGSSPLKDVTVEDTLPAGIEFVDGEIKVGGVVEANAEGNHFEVTLFEVAHGRPVEVSFMVRATIKADDTVTNKATVKYAEKTINPSVKVEVIRGSLEITKLDEEGQELKGAKFALYQCPEAGSLIDSCSESIEEAISNEEGIILFEDLERGYYRLVETQAPEGYSLLTKPIDLGLIDVDSYEIQEDVINYKTGWELPTTGGMGTYWFYSLGVLFILVALYATRKMKKLDL